jgi:hypothetical protein
MCQPAIVATCARNSVLVTITFSAIAYRLHKRIARPLVSGRERHLAFTSALVLARRRPTNRRRPNEQVLLGPGADSHRGARTG